MSESMIDTDSHTIGDTGEEHLRRIHSSNVQALDRLVADANRRLSRAGIDERFEYDIRARHDVVTDGLVDTSFDIALRRPRIGYAGWALAATVVIEEAGTILRTVPGEDLSHWNRPDAHYCDHCTRTQYRTRSYVLRHTDTGEIRQVGSSCLSLFLGVTLRGLWVLEMFTAAELEEWRLPSDTDEHGPRGPQEAITAHVPTVLRLALVISEHGRRFVSRRAAADNGSQRATADAVLDALLPRPHAPADHRRWAAEMQSEAIQVPQDQVDALRAHADTLDGDYGMDMRTLLAGDVVTLRSLPLLVSLVGAQHRAQERAAALAAIAPGYIGEVGEKVTVDATVTTVRSVPTDWGVSELVLFRTTCGHVLKWFTKSAPDIAVGDLVTVAAKVKAHEQYRGVDQTSVVRPRIVVRSVEETEKFPVGA